MKKVYVIITSWFFLFSNQVFAQVTINPGDNIQTIVNAHPAGTSFFLKAGLYRLQNVAPKANDIFIGENGAIMNGSTLLQNWTFNGTYWVQGGQTQSGQTHGDCDTGYPGCIYPEDLFMDDIPLIHVTTLAAVTTGSWYFDYSANNVYMADNPAGHKMEISTARRAFGGSVNNVTIKNLIIEKYAIPAQMGAIGDQYPGRNWIIENNEIRLNHGTGVIGIDKAIIRGNNIHDNGQNGVAMRGTGGLVDNNEISHNNYAGFNAGWEAGGTKFVYTDSLIVSNNHVHDNAGPGLWTDIDNIHTTYEGNIVEDNRDAGIFHEISYDAVIRCNTVRRNGTGFYTWLWGAQIQIAASSNVQVYNNTVVVDAAGGHGIALLQQNRGTGTYGPWLNLNNSVYNNEIFYMGTIGASGAVQDCSCNPNFFTSNYFTGNTYHHPNILLTQNNWAWNNQWLYWSGFQSAGQESNGTVNSNTGSLPIVFQGCPVNTLTTPVISDLNDINIYPNPSTNYLTIESSLQTIIEISNIQGQLIKTLATSENKTNIDVSGFSIGVYIVRIWTDKGITTKKFLKE